MLTNWTERYFRDKRWNTNRYNKVALSDKPRFEGTLDQHFQQTRAIMETDVEQLELRVVAYLEGEPKC